MFCRVTATYAVAAGLGGGGIWLMRDASGQVTEFDFLTKAPKAGGAYALPGAVAGFAALQKQYGALPWQRVVAPGEAYAATGFPVSQALAVRLASAQNILRLDAGLAAAFLDEAGQPGDLGSTGFAAVDAGGAAAACAVTLNGPFGSARMATGTGVVLGATPSGPAGLASAFLTPVIATSGGAVGLAGAGAGGPRGTAAALQAVLDAAGGRRLGKRGDLRGTGAAPYDMVNMISCGGDACVALTDPGAHGLGAAA